MKKSTPTKTPTTTTTKTTLKEGEVLNHLLGFEGMVIIQRRDMFSFSLDSVLLAAFTNVPKRVSRILDFGTGFAPVPLMLSRKTKKPITGIEIQPEVADIARRSVLANGLEHQIDILEADIASLTNTYPHESVELITCNPPFFRYTTESNTNDNAFQTIARHEVKITFETMVDTAATLLKDKGLFVFVHRPERLTSIVAALNAKRMTIKRMRVVHARIDRPAQMVLIEAVKGGRDGLTLEPPFFVHKDDGSYTDAVEKLFRHERT